MLYAILLERGGCLRAHITLFELVEPEQKKKELASEENSFMPNKKTVRFTSPPAGYHGNGKLPVSSCIAAIQVLHETDEWKQADP